MKDLKLPYFLDESILTAVRECLDLHISADIDLMTEFIIESYSQFNNKIPRLFRSSVEKAYEYIMKTELKCNNICKKKSTPKSLILPVNSTSKQKKAIPLKEMKPVKNNSSGFKHEIMSFSPNRKKPSKKGQFNNNFFVIDVEGDEDVKQCDADVTIIKLSEQINDKVTPAPKFESVEKNLSTPTTSIKKRGIEGKNIEHSIQEKLKKKARLNFLEENENITFAELGGLEPVTATVNDALWRLRVPSLRPVTVLLSGPPASGKTVLVSAMVQATGLPVVPVCLGELVNGTTLNPERKVLDSVMTAFSSAPAIVLLSQLDRVCRYGDSGTALNARQAETVGQALLKALKYLRSSLQGSKLLVVAETNAVEAVEARLIKCFKIHIAIKPPTASQRTDILQCVCSELHMSECVDLQHLGLKCSGYVAGDIVDLVEEATIMATKRCGGLVASAPLNGLQSQDDIELPTVTITQQDFLAATKKIIPVLKKEGFPAIPDTTWKDVGGLHSIREELRVKMIDPIKEPDLMSRYSNDTSGILLWGPPGCEKTLLAKAVANEAGINLLIVNGPDLLSMYQGESERAVRMVFGRAASVAPCVIFFDEFDSLCPRRSKTGTESGSKSTIVNTLLTEMNGFMDRAGVYVMAATNLPAVLDPAVLRPGRFDTLLYVGLPDLEGRVSVFKAATRNGTLPRLASDVDLQSIAARCPHFSGADCRHLVKTAETEAREELKRWRTRRREDAGDVITEHSEHREEQFHCQRPNADNNTSDGSQNINAQSSVEMKGTGEEPRDYSDQSWEDVSEEENSEQAREDDSEEEDSEQAREDVSEEEDSEQAREDVSEEENSEQAREDVSEEEDSEQAREDVSEEEDSEQAREDVSEEENSEQAREDVSEEENSEQAREDVSEEEDSEQAREDVSEEENSEQAREDVSEEEDSEQAREDDSEEENSEQAREDVSEEENSEQAREDDSEEEDSEQAREDDSEEENSEQAREDDSEEEDSEQAREDAQLSGARKESSRLNQDANTITLNRNACVLNNICDDANLSSKAVPLDASRMQINGKIDEQRDNPFYEGDYLVYSRHFEAALRKVKASVSEKERFKYEDQEKRKKFS